MEEYINGQKVKKYQLDIFKLVHKKIEDLNPAEILQLYCNIITSHFNLISRFASYPHLKNEEKIEVAQVIDGVLNGLREKLKEAEQQNNQYLY